MAGIRVVHYINQFFAGIGAVSYTHLDVYKIQMFNYFRGDYHEMVPGERTALCQYHQLPLALCSHRIYVYPYGSAVYLAGSFMAPGNRSLGDIPGPYGSGMDYRGKSGGKV